jgi:hypothetical protein
MAFSNRDAALRIFTHPTKDTAGSNFTVARTENPSYLAGFRVHTYISSYRTTIAQLVQREDNPQAFELWLTATRYSHTTDRHMHWIRNALYLHNSSTKPTAIPGAVPSYTVPQRYAHALMHRTHPENITEAIKQATHHIADADKPRLHPPTRIQHLHHAHRILTQALFNATDNIPHTHPSHRTYPELREAIADATAQLHYVDRLISLASVSVDQMRASVRAVQELARDNHATQPTHTI